MYKDFYHMRIEPFRLLPLPGIFYGSRTHKEAWYYLLYGINTREPFLLLLGDYGMGKTTLCLRLVSALKKNGRIPFVHISTPNYRYSEILEEIARSLKLDLHKTADTSLQSLIFHHFAQHRADGGINVIIDDAGEMDIETLSKLRLLANYNERGFFPVRLILFAHSSFAERLKEAALQPLRQRIKRRYRLEPFDLEETKEYIYFRLLKSGAAGEPAFTEEALRLIFDYSGGVPRTIGSVCDNCLLLGAMQGLRTIDASSVRTSLDNLENGYREPALAESPQKAASGPAADAAAAPGTPTAREAPPLSVGYAASEIEEPFAQVGGRAGHKELRIFIIATIVLILGMFLAIVFDFRSIIKGLM